MNLKILSCPIRTQISRRRDLASRHCGSIKSSSRASMANFCIFAYFWIYLWCTCVHVTLCTQQSVHKYFLDLSLMYMCTRNIMYTTKCTQITMLSTRKFTNVHSSPKPCVYLLAYTPFSVGLDLSFYLFGILINNYQSTYTCTTSSQKFDVHMYT